METQRAFGPFRTPGRTRILPALDGMFRTLTNRFASVKDKGGGASRTTTRLLALPASPFDFYLAVAYTLDSRRG